MRAVSNTSPICYLVLIGEIELLPALGMEVSIPGAVADELAAHDAPDLVREWIADPPDWLDIVTMAKIPDSDSLDRLDPGEREAIALAEEIGSELIILDDRNAREVASARGLDLTGLIGILGLGIEAGLIDPQTVIGRLQQTNFRISNFLLNYLRR